MNCRVVAIEVSSGLVRCSSTGMFCIVSFEELHLCTSKKDQTLNLGSPQGKDITFGEVVSFTEGNFGEFNCEPSTANIPGNCILESREHTTAST